MNSDEDRAVPMLEKILQGNQSKRLRERALFVLAQSDNAKARNLISRIAKGEVYPELQLKAIHQIGIVNNSEENAKTLAQIYATTTNYDVKRTILHTFGVSGETGKLLQAARTEKDPKLQRDAIHGLGISGAQTELRQLYKELPSEEAKSAVLDAFIVSGDSEGFAMVAKTEPNPKLRKQAIRGIGISGGKGSGAALVQIYQQNTDPETRDAALEGLFISGDAHDMITLAKSEKDPAQRKRIISKLAVMGDKEANDYMIELLNK
jgi:HEAT repeat protein